MASVAGTSHAEHRRNVVRRVLLCVVYLLALSGLIAWEYRDRLELLSANCDVPEPGSKPAFYSFPYKRLLEWASRESANHVSLVAIPLELQDIQRNTCLGREYLADLLRSIEGQHPAEVVIDKFFGPTTCAKFPEATQELLSVVHSLPFPVVVGESTTRMETEREGTCLVRKPQLDFGAANVVRGFTRLEMETQSVPLQWRVLSSEDGKANVEMGDTLSWSAVKVYDPDLESRLRLRTLLQSDRPPFAKLDFDLPRQTSSQVLCQAGTPEMQKRWSLNCAESGRPLNLRGKVVLIGAEDTDDRWYALNMRLWGFELQGRYIQALLSGSYLSALPDWLTLTFFACFVFIIEGLPTLMEAYLPHLKDHRVFCHAFQRRRYVWVVVWTIGSFLLTTAACLAFGYLPPLAAFGDIFLLVITRLLFYAAESSETPLLHADGKAHYETP